MPQLVNGAFFKAQSAPRIWTCLPEYKLPERLTLDKGFPL